MDDKILSFIPKVYFPGSIFFGKQSFSYLKTINASRIIYVVSSHFAKDNRELAKQLVGSSKLIIHSGEPTELDVKRLRKSSKNSDIIIALGGGSVIDLVKTVKKELGLKMVAIPTTIGSGAEVSRFSLITDSNAGKKNVISSPDLLPEVILLNPLLYKNLEKREIIYQCIDSLSHAIESLVSRFSNPLSDMLSITSLDNLYESLLQLKNGDMNEDLLDSMKTASLLSGFAQSIAATGLIHSFAHYFGAKNGIAHSKAVSLFFLDVLELNARSTDKYKKLNNLKNMSEGNFIRKLKALFAGVDLPQQKITMKEDVLVSAEEIRKNISTLSNPYSPKLDEIALIIRKHL